MAASDFLKHCALLFLSLFHSLSLFLLDAYSWLIPTVLGFIKGM